MITKNNLRLLVLLCVTFYQLNGQVKTNEESTLTSIKQRSEQMNSSFLNDYRVRSIGPVVQGGRITDIVVAKKDPKTFYVAYASGGLFKTENNGITFRPIFDDQGTLGMGDIALAPSDDNIIWIGTGEKNSSRSSYVGCGVYKSNDGGANWLHMGLTNTQHISRVIIHPTDPNIVWVAVIGALYTTNKERGRI